MAGYAGYSMSNNAISAYADGKIPLSNITRSVLDEYGIQMSVPMFRWLCRTVKGFQPCEWHHTGLYFNETFFYDLPAISRTIAKWSDDVYVLRWNTRTMSGESNSQKRKRKLLTVPSDTRAYRTVW